MIMKTQTRHVLFRWNRFNDIKPKKEETEDEAN